MLSDGVENQKAERGRLLSAITCPNCWHHFPPERLLFVARHAELIGDDVVGPSAYRRFLPVRFNVAGNALDARGMECQELACPHCHLVISRPLIELAPRFFSTIGAPASGKSYFLAATIWQMRAQAARFNLVYADGDPSANEEIQRYEETLFLNADADTPVEIRKTETRGSQLYQTIMLDGQSQTFPRPFVFTVNPSRGHPRGGDPQFPRHSLVLYDNAGEHFLPGQDSAGSPVTLHVARSAVLMFVFDPTQDPRFRRRCRSDDPQLRHGLRPSGDTPLMRQEILLNELAVRIRRYRGLAQTQPHEAPLIMVLAKADIWHEMIDLDLEREPVTQVRSGDGAGVGEALDLARIEAVSHRCRALMQELCPEIVAAAEGLSEQVHYVPVSALGRSPEVVEKGERTFYGIRPRDIQPRWVTAPMLRALVHAAPGLVPTAGEDAPAAAGQAGRH